MSVIKLWAGSLISNIENYKDPPHFNTSMCTIRRSHGVSVQCSGVRTVRWKQVAKLGSEFIPLGWKEEKLDRLIHCAPSTGKIHE